MQSFLSIGWVALDAAALRQSLDYKLFTAAHTTASVFPLANRASRWTEPARIRNLIARWIPGRLVSTQTEKCYAATSDCADVAVRFFGVQTRKVEVAPLGVDTELMSPIATVEQSDQRAALRSRLGVAPEEVLFIYTGQFTAAKNPLILAETVEAMRTHGAQVRAIFLGDGVQRDLIARHWIEHRPAVRAAPGIGGLLSRRRCGGVADAGVHFDARRRRMRPAGCRQ